MLGDPLTGQEEATINHMQILQSSLQLFFLILIFHFFFNSFFRIFLNTSHFSNKFEDLFASIFRIGNFLHYQLYNVK